MLYDCLCYRQRRCIVVSSKKARAVMSSYAVLERVQLIWLTSRYCGTSGYIPQNGRHCPWRCGVLNPPKACFLWWLSPDGVHSAAWCASHTALVATPRVYFPQCNECLQCMVIEKPTDSPGVGDSPALAWFPAEAYDPCQPSIDPMGKRFGKSCHLRQYVIASAMRGRRHGTRRKGCRIAFHGQSHVS